MGGNQRRASEDVEHSGVAPRRAWLWLGCSGMQSVAAPRPVGTRLCPSGQRGKQAGLVGGARHSLPCGRPSSSDPMAAEQGVQEATLTSVQRPYAPRNAVVAATSCGSCLVPLAGEPLGRRSLAGRDWQQCDPNAHSGCGRARGRPTNALGCARPHQAVGVAAPRPAPTERVRLFGRTHIRRLGRDVA